MMKKIYTLAIVLLVLGVSSCKLGKHYSRPELRLPEQIEGCLLYTSPSPRDQRGSRMPSSA